MKPVYGWPAMLAQLLVVFIAKVTSAPWLTCSGPSYVLGRDSNQNWTNL